MRFGKFGEALLGDTLDPGFCLISIFKNPSDFDEIVFLQLLIFPHSLLQ